MLILAASMTAAVSKGSIVTAGLWQSLKAVVGLSRQPLACFRTISAHLSFAASSPELDDRYEMRKAKRSCALLCGI